MIENQRHLFDIPDTMTYLQCASQSPLLRASVAAGEIGVSRKAHPWGTLREDATREAHEARALFAGLIGASAADIALVPATSYGVAIAAANLDIATHQEVLVLQEQYPSNYYAWHHLAEARGAKLVTTAWPSDGDWTAAVLENIKPETGIVSVPPCHWTDGGALDLVSVGAACRAVGAALVIDATQFIGAAPFDVAAVQPDFLVCSAYKWLLCPYTLAFLYAAPHRQNGRPIEFHDGARQGDPAQTQNAAGYAMDFRNNAHRYDMGERNNCITMPMAVAAMTQLHEWTPEGVSKTLGATIDQFAEGAVERGYTVPPPAHRVSHFIGLRSAEPPPADLDARCAADDVYFNLRGGAIRVAPHLHVNQADIDRFFAVLDRHHTP